MMYKVTLFYINYLVNYKFKFVDYKIKVVDFKKFK